LIQCLYEDARKAPGCQEDLSESFPENRNYEGAPDLRGVERVSLRIGARVVSLGADGPTKLSDLAEFHWDNLALTPCLEVSWWENTLKNRLVRRILQRLKDVMWYD
jgi:hypothetical protein